MDIKRKIARYFKKSKRKYADAVDKLFDEIACDIDVLDIAYQKIKRPKAELNAYKPLVLEGYDYDYKFFSTFKLANFKFSEVRSTFYKKAALVFAQDKMYVCEYVFSGISDYRKESYYEIYYNAINSVGIETEIAEFYEPDKEDKKDGGKSK